MSDNIFIHPTSIVETEHIGPGTHIGPFCYITKKSVIGANCIISAHCSIGTPPEDKSNRYPDKFAYIGDNTVIRESSVVNTGIFEETIVGSGCYIMSKVHVGHDVVVGNNSVIGTCSILAGHVKLGDFCYTGLGCSTHQFAKLGSYSIIGIGSAFKGESPMGIVWAGVLAKPIKVNVININKNAPLEERQKIIDDASKFIEDYYRGKK